jgi:hypothetical protein
MHHSNLLSCVTTVGRLKISFEQTQVTLRSSSGSL